jgi:hypothetical protein
MTMTWTTGDQGRLLSGGLKKGLDRIGAGRADCGQYASRSDGVYQVGSIHPYDGSERQALGYRTPIDFDESHLLIEAVFRNFNPIPRGTQGVAFNDPLVPPPTWSWHYGRLEADGSITMTDANAYDRPGMGGMLSVFDADTLITIGERGIQPIKRVPDLNGFADYCSQHYNMTAACFFFVYFG